jgi:hypothetical protein
MNRYGQHKLPMATAYTAAYALSHVSIGGQSLGIGWAGTPPTSTTQPFSNVMFNYGMVSEAANNGGGSSTFTVPTSLVPLIEQTDGSYGETIASGFVNSITKWALESGIVMPLLVTNWAIGGMGMSGLIKGTGPYANGQSQVTYGKSVGIAGGFPTVGTRGLLWVHGEADWQNASYDTQLATMQTNYETDTKTITGQATDIPMILCQCSGAGNQAGVAPGTLLSPYLQLQVSINNPGKVVLTGPSYQCLYANVHMQAAGYRKNAGYFAKAWYKTVIQNLPWRPLSPRRIVRDGSNVFVDFWVPVPPIVIDTTTITQPSFVAGSLAGFEWWDASGSPPAITAVNIIGPTSLQIVLASVPSGSNKQLRYAYSFTTGAVPGPFTGQRGNLRDSDTTTSYYGDPLPNWCVHFSQVCN